ncbi:hypothetical protein ACFQ3R_06105 [Mesonia ostreae]|uniref:SHOCT domain-containing protein n=1 Tax=Mesonia ostreae TaxID=861110 RepID=A0ABU2KHB1_9FLAO|nr:hypothetical protein [Mesonia ostreae]MDT0294087.1 hypothetical protein [Mesonia ostreae]
MEEITQYSVTLLLPYIIAIIIFTLIFLAISGAEKIDKITKVIEPINKDLIKIALISIPIIVIAWYSLIIFSIPRWAFFATIIFIKGLLAYYVSIEAVKMNRNGFLWFVLGFIEFHSALIVLGLGKTLYKVPRVKRAEIKLLNDKTREKLSSLKEITTGITNESVKSTEYYLPLRKIQTDYSKEFNELVDNVKKAHHKDSMSAKYERAYKAGVLSKEEYEIKLKNLSKSKRNL